MSVFVEENRSLKCYNESSMQHQNVKMGIYDVCCRDLVIRDRL